jgi:hypothetical protein
MLPTLSQIQGWDTTHLEVAATQWASTADTWEDAFTQIHHKVPNPGGVPWQGHTAEAALARTAHDRYTAIEAADCVRDAATAARLGAAQIQGARQAALDAVSDAEAAGFSVGEDLSVTGRTTGGSPARQAARQAQAEEHAATIRLRAADLLATDRDVANGITTAVGGVKPTIQGVDNRTFKSDPADIGDDQRRRNEIEAFKQVFGREPTSAADWETAAALDPHSYDPKFQGVGPQVKVVKIRPVPGQGVVRMSQWIAQRDVTSWPFPNRDLGNSRGPNAHFDPEDNKVTTYIDYENGIVVMRQNPSVEETPTGAPGQVKVGVPQGSVTQTADGAVRIKYDAGNPFAPGLATDPQGPVAGHQVTVNGDLVFTPGPQGVHVGGTRTNYPSMEVYQDLPGGGTHTVLIDPAQSGRSWGPAVNLPRHHDVGIGGKAFEPFDRGGWNPRYDVRVPLPSTEFGPVTNPPSVPPLPTGVAVPS